jgi:hypothetical protein
MVSWLDTITAPLKTARDMTTQFVEVRDAIKFGEIKSKLQAEIMAAYDAAMDMREREATLIDENATLKRSVADLEARNAQLDRYELKQLPPGVFVRALKPNVQPVEPQHYACDKCYRDGEISPLNSILIHNGIATLLCSRCNTAMKTGYYTPPKPSRAIMDYDIFTGR